MRTPTARIITGTQHKALAEQIAEYLQLPLTQNTITRFSDGEIYAKIEESARGDDCYVIQPTSAPVNDSLMELLIVIDALRRASVHSITAVIPYFGYARQDRKAASREPITAKLVANLLTSAGVDRIITIDLHAPQIQGFFDIPVDNLTGVPLLTGYIRSLHIPNLTVVSPDVGSVRRARSVGKILNTPIAIIDKRRPVPGEAEVMNIVGEVHGRNCLLMDDMIDTGGTIVNGVKALKAQGAKEVYVAATHGVLSGSAIGKLTACGAEQIILTNTTPLAQRGLSEKFHILSIATLLGEAIGRIHRKESLHTLFNDMLSRPQKRLQH